MDGSECFPFLNEIYVYISTAVRQKFTAEKYYGRCSLVLEQFLLYCVTNITIICCQLLVHLLPFLTAKAFYIVRFFSIFQFSEWKDS